MTSSPDPRPRPLDHLPLRGEPDAPALLAGSRQLSYAELDDAVGHIRRQHLPKAVDAAVVVEEELLHSDEAMELDPLLQVGGLVPEDGASRKVVHLERF